MEFGFGEAVFFEITNDHKKPLGRIEDMPGVSIKTHGVVDYLVGLLLVTSPVTISYPDDTMKIIGVAFGAVILVYSAMTDYPLGLLRFIPVPVHRAADLLAGGGLAFSPIHFAVHGLPAVLFVVLGVCLLVVAVLTSGKFSNTGQDNPILPGL